MKNHLFKNVFESSTENSGACDICTKSLLPLFPVLSSVEPPLQTPKSKHSGLSIPSRTVSLQEEQVFNISNRASNNLLVRLSPKQVQLTGGGLSLCSSHLWNGGSTLVWSAEFIGNSNCPCLPWLMSCWFQER